MKNLIPKIILIGVALLMAASFSHATTRVVQLSMGGNPNCNQLTNATIRQASDNNYPVQGGFDTVAAQDQTFQYKLTTNGAANNTIEWSVTSPDPKTLPTTSAKRVNFLLLRQQGNTTIAAYYAEPGVFQDSVLTTPNSITGVTFCFGLNQPNNAQTTPLVAPSECRDQNNNPIFDCSVPAGSQARIISILDEPTNGGNWKVSTCSCSNNGQAFTECDPNIPAGSPGACTRATDFANGIDGGLRFLPTALEFGLNPDSYYCTVIFGTKRCWSK